jgi:hypothetical protein
LSLEFPKQIGSRVTPGESKIDATSGSKISVRMLVHAITKQLPRPMQVFTFHTSHLIFMRTLEMMTVRRLPCAFSTGCSRLHVVDWLTCQEGRQKR